MSDRAERMTGWRARIGLLVPSVNTVAEPEMALMAPAGVALHTSRLSSNDDISDDGVGANLDGMVQSVEDSLAQLPLPELEAVAFCCTSGSFYRGGTWDTELAAHVERLGRKPTVVTSGAMVAALKALGARRLAIASPYVDSMNRQLRTFFEAQGFTIVGLAALHTQGAYANGNHTRETIRDVALQADDERAEAIVMPCTNFPAAQVVEEVEDLVGKPVVTANQATLWQVLEAAGVGVPAPGFGRLLAG